MSAQENQVALPLRDHTILAYAKAIGEDFGFNPIFLRVPLAAMVIVNPTWAFGAYFALGAIVLASRLLFPTGRPLPTGQGLRNAQRLRRTSRANWRKAA